jgi:predicted DNA-binding transcriptional regulator YafY
MTSEARHLTIVPDDPEAREARGPLRLFEELVRLASGETHLTVLNEDLAAALRVEVRTVQRWKQTLRLATPPVVEIRRGNHYVIHMTAEGAAKVLSGSPRAQVCTFAR